MAVTLEKAGANNWLEIADTLNDTKRLDHLVEELKDGRYRDNQSILLKALKEVFKRNLPEKRFNIHVELRPEDPRKAMLPKIVEALRLVHRSLDPIAEAFDIKKLPPNDSLTDIITSYFMHIHPKLEELIEHHFPDRLFFNEPSANDFLNGPTPSERAVEFAFCEGMSGLYFYWYDAHAKEVCHVSVDCEREIIHMVWLIREAAILNAKPYDDGKPRIKIVESVGSSHRDTAILYIDKKFNTKFFSSNKNDVNAPYKNCIDLTNICSQTELHEALEKTWGIEYWRALLKKDAGEYYCEPGFASKNPLDIRYCIPDQAPLMIQRCRVRIKGLNLPFGSGTGLFTDQIANKAQISQKTVLRRMGVITPNKDVHRCMSENIYKAVLMQLTEKKITLGICYIRNLSFVMECKCINYRKLTTEELRKEIKELTDKAVAVGKPEITLYSAQVEEFLKRAKEDGIDCEGKTQADYEQEQLWIEVRRYSSHPYACVYYCFGKDEEKFVPPVDYDAFKSEVEKLKIKRKLLKDYPRLNISPFRLTVGEKVYLSFRDKRVYQGDLEAKRYEEILLDMRVIVSEKKAAALKERKAMLTWLKEQNFNLAHCAFSHPDNAFSRLEIRITEKDQMYTFNSLEVLKQNLG